MDDGVELTSVGADIDWPDSAAGTAVRDRLAGNPYLGHLAALAEWWRAVRPGDQLTRPCVVTIGAEASDLVVSTADALGASCRHDDGTGTVATGAALADAAVDSGTDLLVVAAGAEGVDAAVAVSVLTNSEPVKVLARGVAATDPDAWMDRAAAVRDARRACMRVRADPDQLLERLNSPRLAVTAGLLLRAAARRTPVLIDGPVAAAAALVGYEAQPRAVRWWAAADLGGDPAHALALTRMGQQAILGLGTGLGDGLAGLLAVPAIRAAEAIGR
ncbi:MAG TPA: nicotinate-nucleotide--dimethylbenzimidazole phosphoribosyltransferase [Jatrophihabitans sp.]